MTTTSKHRRHVRRLHYTIPGHAPVVSAAIAARFHLIDGNSPLDSRRQPVR